MHTDLIQRTKLILPLAWECALRHYGLQLVITRPASGSEMNASDMRVPVKTGTLFHICRFQKPFRECRGRGWLYKVHTRHKASELEFIIFGLTRGKCFTEVGVKTANVEAQFVLRWTTHSSDSLRCYKPLTTGQPEPPATACCSWRVERLHFLGVEIFWMKSR